ncbi:MULTISPECIES: hypothetical protein [Flavobacterium]|uniref:hypothetical protein n=1 Tax=Flavobacterium TaxID=237 RepID=UPI001FCC7F4F|nr:MULTISPECIES: hypothetical protein [Flavobacterium]UOK42228.1 hypothetical protein LZF87_13025 [Flavobacterium enshiense]
MYLILKKLNKITIKNYLKYFVYFILVLTIQSCNSESKNTNSVSNGEDYRDNEKDLEYNFATIEFEKTKNKGIYNAKLNYYPRINDKSEILIFLSQDVKSDFSNLEKVKYDTIKVKNGIFHINSEKSGLKILRGFVLERYPVNPKDTLGKEQKLIEFYETKTYIEQKLYVE